MEIIFLPILIIAMVMLFKMSLEIGEYAESIGQNKGKWFKRSLFLCPLTTAIFLRAVYDRR